MNHMAPMDTRDVLVTEYLAAIGSFRASDLSAAIWQRDYPAQVQGWLDGLHPNLLPRGRVVVRADDVAASVAQLCDASDLPAGPERSWLQEDITGLADYFAGSLDAGFLRLRLDVVTTNACRRFHIDAITARLVCTYRGSGTQYGFAENNQDPSCVSNVPTGAPILLRGTLWKERGPNSLLHRSPPIEGTGESRLVLVLDPVFDPADALALNA